MVLIVVIKCINVFIYVIAFDCMGKAKSLEVLIRLYDNMKESFSDMYHGLNNSDYDDGLRASLAESEVLGLKWGDFYIVHEGLVEEDKRKHIEKLRKDVLRVDLMRGENDISIYLVSSGERIKFNSKMTVEEFYSKQKEIEVAKVEEGQIVKVFPEDRIICPDDFSEAQNYFSGNLRY